MKKTNLSDIMNRMIGILCVMLALYIVVSSISVNYIWKQTNHTMESTVRYYARNLDTKFNEVNGILTKLVLSDQEVSIFSHESKYTDEVSIFRAYTNITSALNNIQILYGRNFAAFLYFGNKAEFITSGHGDFTLQEWKTVRDAVFEKIKQEDTVNTRWEEIWSIEEIDGETYAISYFYYQGIYACAFTAMDRLADRIDILDLGEDARIVFTQAGKILNENSVLDNTNLYYEEEKNLYLSKDSGFGENTIVQELDYGDFTMNLVVRNQTDIVRTLLIQWVIIILFILAAAGATIIFYLAKKRIMEPMQYFTENLARIEVSSEEAFFESSSIKELEMANELFRKIFEEIKKLKIEYYEQILENQKVQLDYMQLQIQPHFYVNSLNIIYNMACIGEYEGIQQMTANISEYLRYIFRPSDESVSLDMEMKHIENYLVICKQRYFRDFTYEVLIKCRIEDIILPPLIIQTFVENAVKYSVTLDTPAHISIDIERVHLDREEFIMIQIEDSGSGFDPEVLEYLQGEIPFNTKDGTRIGIVNTVKRLRMLYGEKGSIRFFNKETGGAVVHICIPSRFPENGRKGIKE